MYVYECVIYALKSVGFIYVGHTHGNMQRSGCTHVHKEQRVHGGSEIHCRSKAFGDCVHGAYPSLVGLAGSSHKDSMDVAGMKYGWSHHAERHGITVQWQLAARHA